jgi:hypothetical protein
MIGLVLLIDEHGPAIEYDLIKLGLRLRQLGTDLLSWRDLLVIVQHTERGSALSASMDPDSSTWGLSEHLLAVVADAVIAGNWMSSRDGQKNRNRPKPIPRPGIVPESKKFGGRAESIDTIRDWLGWEETTPTKPSRPRDARGRFIKTK